jgi:hypothetical protein
MPAPHIADLSALVEKWRTAHEDAEDAEMRALADVLSELRALERLVRDRHARYRLEADALLKQLAALTPLSEDGAST